jgi:hypothetical protein
MDFGSKLFTDCRLAPELITDEEHNSVLFEGKGIR